MTRAKAGADVATVRGPPSPPPSRVMAEAVECPGALDGALDIMVNDAGIIRRSDAVDFTKADWDAVIDSNLISTFLLCRAAA